MSGVAKDGYEARGSWRAKLKPVCYLAPLLSLVWKTHRAFATAMIVLRLCRGVLPVASLWIAKLIVDAVIHAGELGVQRVWRLVALEMTLSLLAEALARSSSLVESLLGDLFTCHVSLRLMEHAATLDLAHFENPKFYDHLERARQQSTGRLALIVLLLALLQDALTVVTLAAALLVAAPWLLLLLLIALLPGFWGETHYASLSYSLSYSQTPYKRELDYVRYVGASNETAKEVQVFGLAPWLVQRFRALSERYYSENKRLAVRRSVSSTALAMLATGGYYAAYVLIVQRALSGAVTIGGLTFLAGGFMRSRDLVQRLLLTSAEIYKEMLGLRDLFLFLETRPSIVATLPALPFPSAIREGIVFADVGFKYPGAEGWAVRHVSLRIGHGERIALVGENGSGKTTITKLLARLYEPTEGCIYLDGVDIREYDLQGLRAAIAVIFQDFVQYDMRLDENVGVGDVGVTAPYFALVEAWRASDSGRNSNCGALACEPTVFPAIVEAARRSLADALVPRLKDGYGQMLGRRFDRGVELSGGEWQKVALARAYMRNAQLVILDEPTAALDARAEYEVFSRFSDLMEGRMAVVISHRFSAVREADRIIVLKRGCVVEEGTHASLVVAQGLYAELFEMQAVGYRSL
jgi:ABC-type multidrug transport system, ATPase and permease components